MMVALASSAATRPALMADSLRLAVAMAGMIAILAGIMVRVRLKGYARGWHYSPPADLTDRQRRRGRIAGAIIWLGAAALIGSMAR